MYSGWRPAHYSFQYYFFNMIVIVNDVYLCLEMCFAERYFSLSLTQIIKKMQNNRS